jgi:hypothetical protein
MHYLAVFSRVLIGTVFLVSAATKLRSPAAFAAFARSVRKMKLVPTALITPVAVAVVAAEVGIVVLLAVPVAVTGLLGSVVAAGLLTAFTVAIVQVVRRGTDLTCQCFGASTVPLGPVHVVRNIVLFAVAVAGALATRSGGEPQLGVAVIAVTAGLVGGGLVTVLDDILRLFVPPAPARR